MKLNTIRLATGQWWFMFHGLLFRTAMTIIFQASLLLFFVVDAQEDVVVKFVNLSPNQSVESIAWINEEVPQDSVENENNEVAIEHDVPPFAVSSINSSQGHQFAVYQGSEREHVTVKEDEPGSGVQHVFLPSRKSGSSSLDIPVECSSTTGDLHITVKPEWSPLGAARFLELVHLGYYDGCALTRVVPNFLTQFGISPNLELRSRFMRATIPDDKATTKIPFQHGFMSYAGSGPDSRTTEVFIVMPNTHQGQLDAFGSSSPWETPFGFVEPQDLTKVVANWYSYGDMPPWGAGPDPQDIYPSNGYSYLSKHFPKLSYLKDCRILHADHEDVDAEEEEL